MNGSAHRWLSHSGLVSGLIDEGAPPPVRQPRKGTSMKTIVMVHGFWVTPRSWENWIDHYQRAGYNVVAPAYPGFEVEVEALNPDPTPIENVTAPEIIPHLESVIGPLEEPPIIMGHSAGGTFTQVLLDRGYGAAGVGLNCAPTQSVRA